MGYVDEMAMVSWIWGEKRVWSSRELKMFAANQTTSHFTE